MKKEIRFSGTSKVISVKDYRHYLHNSIDAIEADLTGKRVGTQAGKEYRAMLINEIEKAESVGDDNAVLNMTENFLASEKYEISNFMLTLNSVIAAASIGLMALGGFTGAPILVGLGLLQSPAIYQAVETFGRKIKLEKNMKTVAEIKEGLMNQAGYYNQPGYYNQDTNGRVR